MVKYPEIKINLTGEDGNAFFILGRCKGAMKNAGLPEETMNSFYKEATSRDYNHLLHTCMEWFNCR